MAAGDPTAPAGRWWDRPFSNEPARLKRVRGLKNRDGLPQVSGGNIVVIESLLFVPFDLSHSLSLFPVSFNLLDYTLYSAARTSIWTLLHFDIRKIMDNVFTVFITKKCLIFEVWISTPTMLVLCPALWTTSSWCVLSLHSPFLPGRPVGNVLRGFSADIGQGVDTSVWGSEVTEGPLYLQPTFGRCNAASTGLVRRTIHFISCRPFCFMASWGWMSGYMNYWLAERRNLDCKWFQFRFVLG